MKTWPRSRSAAIWISSTARNDTSRSLGIASTVETQNRAFGGFIFSSPVISATESTPGAIDDLVVDLARQQPQRQADDPGGMRKHPLDRKMGLAGVGGAEHRGDAAAWGPAVAKAWAVKTKRPCLPGVSASACAKDCFTMRRLGGRGLSLGTVKERNAPESLTPIVQARGGRNMQR